MSPFSMNLELLIAILFGGLLVYRSLFSIRRARMRIIAMSLGTLIIVTAISVVPQNSGSQSANSQNISRHLADEQESQMAIKVYQNKITPDIKVRAEKLVRAAQARAFHKKSPEDFLVLASREYVQNNIDRALDFAYAGLHLNPKNKQVDAALSNITGKGFFQSRCRCNCNRKI